MKSFPEARNPGFFPILKKLILFLRQAEHHQATSSTKNSFFEPKNSEKGDRNNSNPQRMPLESLSKDVAIEQE